MVRGVAGPVGARVLVVEDEEAVRELIAYNLRLAGFDVRTEADGRGCRAALERERFDVVILDIMLPDDDGFRLCRLLRQDGGPPVIFVTARDGESDRILGLELGADDYVTKPFSPRELVARVRAVLRRAGGAAAAAPFRFGDVEVDLEGWRVTRAGRPVPLSRREMELLRFFVLNRGRALTRQQILDAVWGPDFYGETRAVDVYVHHLRYKLEANPARPRHFVTVPGLGYRFEPTPPDERTADRRP